MKIKPSLALQPLLPVWPVSVDGRVSYGSRYFYHYQTSDAPTKDKNGYCRQKTSAMSARLGI